MSQPSKDRKKPRILVTGLNPAWQRTLKFKSLEPGEVNRAESVTSGAAGKGVNFARAARTWGTAEPLLLQFAGADTGAKLLDSLDSEGIRHITETVQPPTRICTTILSGTPPHMTELIEPSGSIPGASVSKLLDAAIKALDSSDALALCGTFPPGVSKNFYSSLAKKAHASGKPVLLDAYMAMRPIICSGVSILKINRQEFESLSETPLSAKAIMKLRDIYALDMLAITDGPSKAFLSTYEGLWMLTPPNLSGGHAVNPIGAGDTCSAILLSCILSGTAPDEAFATALSAASASCLTESPAKFLKRDLAKFRRAVNVFFTPAV